MIYRHKRTGKDYKVLFESFDVERQEYHIVYVQLDTGWVFNRSGKVFHENFVLVNAAPQVDIKPNDPKRK